MAASQKLTDHFLTCTVCTEVFQDPCTLECIHTFCRKCVVNFTKTQPQAIAAKSIPCPFCWKWTKVPDPSKPVEQWADDIKPIFLIQGLLDSFGPKSKDINNCCYCKERGETTPATYWCSVCDDALCDTCLLIHRRIPATRNHDVTDVATEDTVLRKRKVTCKEHPNEIVEFHCQDCKKAVCHKCCIIYHRKCESVVTLESEVEKMKVALGKHRESLMQKEQEGRFYLKKQETRVGNMVQIKSDIQSQIEATYEKVINVIKQNKSKLLQELNQAAQKQTEQLKADIKTTKMAVQIFQQQSELIDQAVKSNSEIQIYEMYQSCESEKPESEDTAWQKNQSTPGMISLRKDTDEMMKAVKEIRLGEIVVRTEKEMDLSVTPVLLDTINVSVPDDEDTACPADVIALDVDGIDTVVVTDWGNSNVKSFYRRNNQSCYSKLDLDNNPWSLTQIKDNQVAATVPASKEIVTAEVNPDLKLLSSIKTEKKYRGITTLSSMLAVGSDTPPCVDILDISGNIIRSISLTDIKENVITKPYFLNTSKTGNIILCNNGSRELACLSPEGNTVFNLRYDISPVCYFDCATSTSSGDILVSDAIEHCIHYISASGHFVRKLLTYSDGMSHLWGIHADKYGRLFVCFHRAGVVMIYMCS